MDRAELKHLGILEVSSRHSKYNEGWKKIFARVGGFKSVLNRVRRGEVVLIPANEIKRYGSRKNWVGGGKVVLSREGVVGSAEKVAAHVRALKNVIPEHIFPGERIKCVIGYRSGQLTLSLRLVSAEVTPVSKVTLLTPEQTPITPSLSPEESGSFYLLISSFERELRNFIKEKMGKGWIKRLKRELPAIIEKWEKRKNADVKWGIEAEKQLINYADVTDYMQIVKRYGRIFTKSDEELSDVTTHLKDFANYGRNPLMHCRTLDQQKYYTTKSVIDFLKEWIKRTSNS
jgi:hypothetical protein